MIHEIDEAIEQLVRNEVLDGSGAEVVFDAPTKDWASRRNSPTVNVYLYDIREDASRRQIGSFRRRDEAGVVTSTEEPPRFFRLAYLVTAWTQRPEDEHRLLSAMLYAFARHSVLPDEYRSGSLVEAPYPVMIELAKPLGETRQISEVWSALGGELKPSLDLLVTAPVPSSPVPVTVGPPEVVRIHTSGTGGEESEMSRQRGAAGPGDGAPGEAAGDAADGGRLPAGRRQANGASAPSGGR